MKPDGRSPAPPSTVHFSLTDLCNLQCAHCDIWKKPRRREFELDEWKRVVDAFAAWLGRHTLKIAGGEPLMKPWLLDLVRHAKGAGLTVGISTNGTLLPEEMVKALCDLGLDEVNISVDSLSDAVHDEMRRRPGTLKKAIETVELFRRHSRRTDINVATVLNRNNQAEVIRMAGWARDHGVRTLTLQPLMQNFSAPYDPLWHRSSPYWPADTAEMAKVLEQCKAFRLRFWTIGNPLGQIEAMKRYFREPENTEILGCTAGQTDVGVDPQGNFLLCFNLAPVGNVLERPPADLFHSEEARQRRTQIEKCPRRCNLLNCVYPQEDQDQ
ncbi:MAG: radical SAM protein [Deltaproteobacteria bacterium]|nr:radical SAM protein [Deltaproteobacteria bacterium]